jgi:outer membrane protein OmpU
MKKVLFATTALILTGGAALAEVTITGSGRFGLLYVENNTDAAETTISTRLRFNIDANTETDSGVTFGGRIRLQYDSGDSDVTDVTNLISGDTGTSGQAGAELSAAKLYAKYGAMTLEVGNVDTAYDSAALMYASEIGFIGRSFGNPSGSYYSFDSGPWDASEVNRMGLAFTYSIDNFNARVSWVTPNQTTVIEDGDSASPTFGELIDDTRQEEYGISLDYTFNQFTVSAAAVMDGAGIDGNDNYFLGAEYKLNDQTTFGLLYFDNGEVGNVEVGNTVTLYGSYGFGATTVRGYIANNDNDANEDDIAFGIGADYDLGGATLAGGIAQGYNSDATADIGVKFNF